MHSRVIHILSPSLKLKLALALDPSPPAGAGSSYPARAKCDSTFSYASACSPVSGGGRVGGCLIVGVVGTLKVTGGGGLTGAAGADRKKEDIV
jgi:hypothetical protein